ncbi:MAG TPA: hypothetical protein PKY10_03665 [Lentisphaeria bacterium]|nr:hypothetical protein [Lentisphaeria bacterium]
MTTAATAGKGVLRLENHVNAGKSQAEKSYNIIYNYKSARQLVAVCPFMPHHLLTQRCLSDKGLAGAKQTKKVDPRLISIFDFQAKTGRFRTFQAKKGLTVFRRKSLMIRLVVGRGFEPRKA